MAVEAVKSGPYRIISMCVKNFISYFTSTAKAKLQNTSRWWNMGGSTSILKAYEKRKLFVVESTRNRKRAHLKSLSGRSRRRATWMGSLYEDLREDFEKLCAAGVKFF